QTKTRQKLTGKELQEPKTRIHRKKHANRRRRGGGDVKPRPRSHYRRDGGYIVEEPIWMKGEGGGGREDRGSVLF
ncbi:hypothetical protein L195_g062039, partial [Trifolium pratense]